MIECVANVSEGRDTDIVARLTRACGEEVLDVHADAGHNRSVFTLLGENAVRKLTASAVDELDIGRHEGVHPRIGVVDVVPFVPLFDSAMGEALDARQSFAEWAAGALDIPCFLYGDAHGSLEAPRSLPDIRSAAWTSLAPDIGPREPHPTAGAICVGARPPLIAFNIWMTDPKDGETVRRIARSMRSERIRTLALRIGEFFQLSMNLVDPASVGPAQAFDIARDLSAGTPVRIERCELVGLVPQSVLDTTPQERWEALDLSKDRTIEYRIRERRFSE